MSSFWLRELADQCGFSFDFSIFRETRVNASTLIRLSELPYLVSVAEPLAIFDILWPPEPSFLVPVANPVGLFYPPGFLSGDVSFTRALRLACFPLASFVSVKSHLTHLLSKLSYIFARDKELLSASVILKRMFLDKHKVYKF